MTKEFKTKAGKPYGNQVEVSIRYIDSEGNKIESSKTLQDVIEEADFVELYLAVEKMCADFEELQPEFEGVDVEDAEVADEEVTPDNVIPFN